MSERHSTTSSVRVLPWQAMMISGSLLISLAFGCTPDCGPEQEGGAIVATIGNRKITQEELGARVRSELMELDAARYDALKTGLNELIDEVLLEQEAQARNLATNELLKLEVEDKAEALNRTDPIGSEDIEQFYDQYKEQLGGQPLDPLRPAIENHLKEQRIQALRAKFTDALREKGNVVVRLRPPRVKVSTDGPSRGPLDAKITIVEFSDFECPYCRNAASTIEQVMAHYDGKVRLVYRNFPLPIHDRARQAAQAAACAYQGGKFWPYHDLLFRNQTALAEDDLTKYAREVGLEEGTFVSCLQDGRSTSLIDKDIADAEAAGVNGTPAFFINGRPLSGAQPYDAFKDAIEDELASLDQ